MCLPHYYVLDSFSGIKIRPLIFQVILDLAFTNFCNFYNSIRFSKEQIQSMIVSVLTVVHKINAVDKNNH